MAQLLSLRAKVDDVALKPLLKAINVDLLSFPMLETAYINENQIKLSQLKSNIAAGDYLIFTSKRAVSAMTRLGLIRGECVAVGSKTAQVAKEAGFLVKMVASGGNTRSLLEEVLANDRLSEKDFIYPTSALANDELENGFHANGIKVKRVNCYTVKTPVSLDQHTIEVFLRKKVDYVFVPSPSAWGHFTRVVSQYVISPLSQYSNFLSMGAKTSERMREDGVKVSWECPNASLLELPDFIRQDTLLKV